MTPTLSGRLQTRIFLAMTIGALWTAAITPALPRPAGMPVSFAYHVTFEALGLMVALGCGWELVYHTIQQARWDKDWPSLVALLVVVPEAVPLWFVTHALDVIPGTVYLSSPITPLYVIHVSTTWVVMWLFMQGPLRVLHIRWRFEGGQTLVRAPGKFRRSAPRPDTSDDRGSLVSAADSADPLGRNRTDLARVNFTGRNSPAGHDGEESAEGVTCPDGHFNHLWARYCEVCGAALLPVTSTGGRGPRPPVGILVLADGASQVVDGDLRVVGSAEEGGLSFFSQDEFSPEPCLADIRLVGWQPVVSSAYGISVSLPGGSRLRLDPHVPVPLVAGAEFEFAGHHARYESPYQAPPPVMRSDSQGDREPVSAGATSMLADMTVAGVAAVCRPVARCAGTAQTLMPRRPRIVALAVGTLAMVTTATALSLQHEFGGPGADTRPQSPAAGPLAPRSSIHPPASAATAPVPPRSSAPAPASSATAPRVTPPSVRHRAEAVGVDGPSAHERTIPGAPADLSFSPSPAPSTFSPPAAPPAPAPTPSPSPSPGRAVSVCPVSVALPGAPSPARLPLCVNLPSLLGQ